jgi:hypothetical protein
MRRDNHGGKKGGRRARLYRKNHSPSWPRGVLMMMGDSFPTIEMAEDYGRSMAQEWIDENVK